MKKYVFEGYISTLTYSQSGKVVGYGNNENEAKEDAIKQVCKSHRIDPSCVKIKKLLYVEQRKF